MSLWLASPRWLWLGVSSIAHALLLNTKAGGRQIFPCKNSALFFDLFSPAMPELLLCKISEVTRGVLVLKLELALFYIDIE